MFRSRSKQESLVGLFILLGIVLFGGIIFFLRGSSFQDKNYQLKLLFNDAGGLREGAKVYYRGVAVGKITSIDPSSNGVEVSTEIDGDLLIPKDVKVTTLRTGLLGDVSINIVPQRNLDSLPTKIEPQDTECSQQNLILCDSEQINAKSTPDLFESLAVITERLNNDQFFEMIDSTLVNVNETTLKIALLSDQLTGTVVELRKELNTFVDTTEKIGNTADKIGNSAEIVNGTVQKFGNTADSLARTADVATLQIDSLSNSYRDTAIELNSLASNLNRLIDDNKTNFSGAIDNFTLTTNEINKLISKTDLLLAEVSTDDVGKISKNISETSDNLSQISQDLRALSAELNNPTNLVTLQQTLDSARVTFANTAKITSDIDEFTGDPEFRNNLRKLVDGLGNLVSYTDVLEKQIELAKLLEEVEKITPKENLTIKNKSSKFPTAFSGDKTNSKFENQN